MRTLDEMPRALRDGSGDSETAICQAIRYLKRRLETETYGLAAVSSDGSARPEDGAGQVFVAFFVVQAIGDALDASERVRLISRINDEARNGLWGYGPRLQVDSDDTAFVLRTLRALGEPCAVRPLFAFRRRRTNAFTTFLSGVPDWVPSDPSVAGNGGIHLEVNANIFRCLTDLGRQDLTNRSFLTLLQQPDGSWPCYFYPSVYYALFIVTDFLRSWPDCRESCDRAVQFLHARQNADGSWGEPGNSYETALAMLTLAQCGAVGSRFDRGVSFLNESQLPDGSWLCELPVWTYRYSDDPPATCQSFDDRRALTTSLCVSALRSAR